MGPISVVFTWLNRLTLVASALLGVVMLFGGDRIREAFPISVGPLTLATWGAWLVGLACHQFAIDRWKRLDVVLPSAVQVWGFFLLLIAYCALFAKVRWDRPLAIPVVAILAIQALTAFAWIASVTNPKQPWQDARPTMHHLLRLAVVGFVLLSLYLGVKLLVTSPSAYADPDGTYPEMLTETSARVFGIFYFVVGLSAIPAAMSRSDTFTLTLARAGLPIVGTILLAAWLHRGLFDFAAQPGARVYLGVYLLIGIIAGTLVLVARRRPSTVSERA